MEFYFQKYKTVLFRWSRIVDIGLPRPSFLWAVRTLPLWKMVVQQTPNSLLGN